MDARSPIIPALTMASASLVPRRSISERPRRRRATALVEGLIALNPDLRDALVALIYCHRPFCVGTAVIIGPWSNFKNLCEASYDGFVSPLVPFNPQCPSGTAPFSREASDRGFYRKIFGYFAWRRSTTGSFVACRSSHVHCCDRIALVGYRQKQRRRAQVSTKVRLFVTGMASHDVAKTGGDG